MLLIIYSKAASNATAETKVATKKLPNFAVINTLKLMTSHGLPGCAKMVKVKVRLGQLKDSTQSASVVKNIQPVKGIIGKKRIADLKKAVANRNARYRRATKKIYGEYTHANADELVRRQYLPGYVRVDFSKIKTLKQYKELMNMLNFDKTKGWKAMRTIQAQEWLSSAVKNSFNIEYEDDPELFDAISKMSADEILRFSIENNELIGELFDHYGEINQNPEEREDRWARTREAFGLSPELGERNIFTVGGIGF